MKSHLIRLRYACRHPFPIPKSHCAPYHCKASLCPGAISFGQHSQKRMCRFAQEPGNPPGYARRRRGRRCLCLGRDFECRRGCSCNRFDWRNRFCRCGRFSRFGQCRRFGRGGIPNTAQNRPRLLVRDFEKFAQSLIENADSNTFGPFRQQPPAALLFHSHNPNRRPRPMERGREVKPERFFLEHRYRIKCERANGLA